MDNSEKIEKTLISLEGMQRAKANPFLFEKIKQRMADKSKVKSIGLKFVLSTSLAVLVIAIINISVWKSYSAPDYSEIKTTQHSEQDISTFAKEYFDLGSKSNY